MYKYERIEDYIKKGCKAFNEKNFDEALLLFRQARGETNHELHDVPDYKRFRLEAYLAEASNNVAECYLKQAEAEQNPIDKKELIAKAFSSLKESNSQLVACQNSKKDAKRQLHASIDKLLSSLIEDRRDVFKQYMFARHNYFAPLFEKYLNQLLESVEKIKQLKEAKLSVAEQVAVKPIIEEFNHIYSIISKSAERNYQFFKKNNDKFSAETMLKVYSQCEEIRGDLYASLADKEIGDENSKALLNESIVSYKKSLSEISKIRGLPNKTKMGLIFSVLHAYEAKTDILSEREDPQLANVAKEMQAFAKSNPIERYKLVATPEDELEYLMYLFSCEKKVATTESMESSLELAEKILEKSKKIKIESGSELEQTIQDVKYFYNRNALKQAILKQVQHPGYSTEDYFVWFNLTTSRISRNGGNGLLNRLFKQPKINGNILASNTLFALESLQKTHSIATKEFTKGILLDNISFIESHNKRVLADYKRFSVQGPQKNVARNGLLPFFDESFENFFMQLESYFSNKQITEAIPGIMSEYLQCLKDNKYPADAINLLEQAHSKMVVINDNSKTLIAANSAVQSNANSTGPTSSRANSTSALSAKRAKKHGPAIVESFKATKKAKRTTATSKITSGAGPHSEPVDLNTSKKRKNANLTMH